MPKVTVSFELDNMLGMGTHRFQETFSRESEALAFLSGYLGAGESLIKEFDVEFHRED